jgi:hypothetical protein
MQLSYGTILWNGMEWMVYMHGMVYSINIFVFFKVWYMGGINGIVL